MRLFLLVWSALAPTMVFGATVIPNSNIVFGPTSGSLADNYVAIVDQEPTGNDTGTWFDFKQISATEGSLRVTLQNADEGSDWYLVEPGDSFSKENIAADKFTPLIVNLQGYPAVTVGSDFYLGVNTGIDFNQGIRSAFGWIHFLAPGGEDLIMVENAMSYDSPGIIVGTHTLVPEPSTLALGSVALLSLAASRRRK